MPAPRRTPAGGGAPDPFRRTASIILALLLIGLIHPVLAADNVVLDEEPTIYIDTGGTLEYNNEGGSNDGNTFNRIRLESVETRPLMPYIGITVSNVGSALINNIHAEGEYHITYTTMGQTKPATMHVEYSKNFFGTMTHARFLIFFDDWDTTGYTGTQYITLSEPLWYGAAGSVNSDSSSLACVVSSSATRRASPPFTITVASVNEWKNRLIVTDDILNSYQVNLQRVYGGVTYPSEITILKGDSTVFYEATASDFGTVYLKSEIDAIKIQIGTKIFQWPLEPAGSDSSAVNVYVKNSQTGALLANARLTIQDTTTDPWTEVVNETLSSGQGSFSLPKDTGIHLTQYRIGATVPGYQQVVPALFARVTGPTNIVVEMEPVEGGPVNETNTFLKFYVRDSAGNGVSSANVLVGDVMRYTNAQGYAQFEVGKNSTYEYTIAKFRYTAVSGRATVLDDESYTVSVTLSPGAVPTYTPPVGTPTPDTRSSAEKAASGLDFILDNAENFGAMAAMILLIYMGYWMVPKK